MNLSVDIKRLNLVHTWTIARGSSDYKDNVFVKIERDGISGIGEAAPNVRYNETAKKTKMRIESARKLLEDADFLQYDHLIKSLRTAFNDQNCAKAALDMAILDWVGKKYNLPLYKIWGLNPEKSPLSSYSIGIDTPENMAKIAQEKNEMPILKIKLGSHNDRDIIKTIRSVTDRVIRIDANEGWTDRKKALAEIRWLADQNIEFVEQPMPAAQYEDMIWLKKHSPLPLIADEAVITSAEIPMLAKAYHGINIKIMKSCGLQEAMTMIRMARSLDMKVMLGCMVESSVAISAAAQLAPLVDYADLDGALLLKEDPFRGVEINKGRLQYSDMPGIGIIKI